MFVYLQSPREVTCTATITGFAREDYYGIVWPSGYPNGKSIRPSKVHASGSKTSYVVSPNVVLSPNKVGGAVLGSMAELAELSAAESGFVGLLNAATVRD